MIEFISLFSRQTLTPALTVNRDVDILLLLGVTCIMGGVVQYGCYYNALLNEESQIK